MSGENNIYLDFAASAPIVKPAQLFALDFFQNQESQANFSNPNSLHSPARKSFKMLEDARCSVAKLIGAKRPDEIIFCSGATEANNLALRGIIERLGKDRRLFPYSDKRCHVITSSIEHPSVLAVLENLSKTHIELSVLKPNSNGLIEASLIEDSIKENTVLCSIQFVNNEIGTIQNVEQISDICRNHGVYFHTDAVQALGKMPISVCDL